MAKIIICKDCGEEKPHKAFGLCLTCYMREYDKARSGRIRPYNEEEHEKGRERAKVYWHKRIKIDPLYPFRRMLKKYKLTIEDYDELLESQGNGCWICGMAPEENGKRLAVDHNHETGEVRGLLCHSCNVGLGHLQDNPQILARAIEYLLKEV